ncbi:hypothetical protein ScoT_37010 [Streptomyces albidoflavus]|uniref:Uncharacterized protein n=1 Tax=Streptomyces albidoflavus TaxID=1886 RepID=A0AA37BZ56_9ACTN|nr:hypothetical protein ScoT_37010 [Streptomyces albidoflavus]
MDRVPAGASGLAWPHLPAWLCGLKRRPGCDVAAPRLGVPVFARARSPIGLKRRPGWDSLWLGSAPAFRASTLRVTDWPQTPAGL